MSGPGPTLGPPVYWYLAHPFRFMKIIFFITVQLKKFLTCIVLLYELLEVCINNFIVDWLYIKSPLVVLFNSDSDSRGCIIVAVTIF